MITWQWVSQVGYLQIATHLGQSWASQALSGHFISQTGFSHFTSQTAFLGSWHTVWQEGGSQIGSQIANIFYLKMKFLLKKASYLIYFFV